LSGSETRGGRRNCDGGAKVSTPDPDFAAAQSGLQLRAGTYRHADREASDLRARLNSGNRATSARGIAAAVLVAMTLGMSPAVAADRGFSKEFDACLNKAAGVTPAMIDCISAELKRQDALLNENYRKLMASLSAKRKNALLEAQRAWLKFRDTNCDFYYDPDGGSAARVDANECLLNTTTDRAQELAQLTR
jgi:uncharacterized protein YecT (DUF1311 family)